MRRQLNPINRTQQAGFNLLEMMIVLVVIIIAVAVAAANIFGATSKNDVAQDVQGIGSLQANTKTTRGSGGYGAAGADLIPTLIALGAIPKTLTLTGTTVTNTWGGSVTVVSTGAGFTITSQGVPKAACIEEAAKLSRGAATTKVGAAAAVNGEVSIAAATASCSADTNTIAWTSAT
ncbi:pilus assembly protein PilX [Xanthomonas campestris pv. campestris]|uniref:type 4 pilus major pilin n=1 Tax=Xanthomonas campestris TaxID=339 RepID=UPI001E3A598E|nr:type 4 pilus major pilin [Xanthomonas campestris]MCD0253117.1 pilus assembly protein PilX [Xanthomonas campestris pv. campestris]